MDGLRVHSGFVEYCASTARLSKALRIHSDFEEYCIFTVEFGRLRIHSEIL